MLLVALFSALIAAPSIASDRLLPSVAFIFTPVVWLVLHYLVGFSVGEGRRLVGVLALSCTAASILMYFQTGPFEYEFTIERLLTRHRGRNAYLLGSDAIYGPTIIAALVGTSILCAIYNFRVVKGVWKVIFGVTTSIQVILLIFTASRTAVASVVAAIVVFGMLSRTQQFKMPSLAAWTYGALLAAAVYWGFGLALEYSPDALYRYQVMLTGVMDESMRGRFVAWDDAMSVISTNPFGSGIDYFPLVYGLTPHNEILGLAVAGGVAAALCYMLILLFWFAIAIRDSRSRDSAVKSRAAFQMSMLVLVIGISMTENYSVSSLSLFYVVTWMVAGWVITGGRHTDSRRADGVAS